MNGAMFSDTDWLGATVMALLSPFCWPVSVRMVTSTLAATFPVFIRYSQICVAPSDCPVPTNHMSDPGCVQLTSPVPDASDCSASNPSAIWPVAATADRRPRLGLEASPPCRAR